MRAFSLVELSIVLVILGLLTGGILAGQSLIRAAELRSVSSESNRYISAIHTFRDKYFALPGDMRNAVKFWGAQDGSTNDGPDSTCTALATAATDARTCNGDGNGNIANGVNSSRAYEMFRAWQHLANAGLIEGTYTGIAGSGGAAHSIIGQNAPASRLSNAGWTLYYLSSSGNAVNYNANYGNNLIIGGQTSSGETATATFKPEEAWNIDIKLDDGLPGRGKILAKQRATCTDSSTASDYDAPYKLSDTTIACALSINIGL